MMIICKPVTPILSQSGGLIQCFYGVQLTTSGSLKMSLIKQI